jgi:hypothetical protein
MTGRDIKALADRFKLQLAYRDLGSQMERSGAEALRLDFVNATVFDFDEPASIAVGKLSLEHLPQLGKIMPDIRLPTKSAILSIRYKAMLQTIYTARHSDFGPLTVADDCPDECLFLVRAAHDQLPVFDIMHATPNEQGTAAFMVPLIYRFDAHGRAASDQVRFSGRLGSADTETLLANWVDMIAGPGTTEGGDLHSLPATPSNTGWAVALRTYHLIGSGLIQIQIAREQIQCLRNMMFQTSIRYLPGVARPSTDAICSDVTFIKEFAGTLRIAVAMLGLLSMRDTEIIEVSDAKRRAGLIRVGARSTPYFKHSTVRLAVPSTRYEYLMKKHAEQASRRRHHVIGHWANRGGLRKCDHTWIDVDVDHKLCSACGRKRFWRHEHDRGSAELGWVIHDRYAVHSSEEK